MEVSNLIEERDELMIPPNKGSLPSLRKAHFLKPISNPRNQPLPELPSPNFHINPNINLIEKRVNFHGRFKPPKSWKTWVDNLQQTHQKTWKKVGIFDAILASTYNIVTQKEFIIKLAENWCPETNTFFFFWGESTITLEDVMILGGFPVMGTSARSQFRLTEGGDIQKKLIHICRTTNKKCSKWMDYFRGIGGEMEHVGLIVLWLSRYVFTTNSYTMISTSVFSLAISLTRGTRIALAPAILASIYRDLRLLKEKIVSCKCEGEYDDGSNLVLWSNLQLVQVWAWERFPTLCPRPISLGHGEPRMARWHERKTSKSRMSKLELESLGDDFLWRPYVLPLENWKFPKFYCDQGMWVLVNSEVDEEFLSFAMCLRTCDLVGIDCMEHYFPYRVAMQFALDQDIPFSLSSSIVDSELAWNSYEKPLDGLKFYLPPRLSEGDVTIEYFEWWRTSWFVHSYDHRCEGSGKKIHSCSSKVMKEQEVRVNWSSVMSKENSGCEDKCEHNVMEEEEEERVNWSNMNMDKKIKCLEETHPQNENIPPYSSPVCNEVMGVEFVESGNDNMLIENLPSCQHTPSHSLLKHFECSAMEKEKEKEVNESDTNMGDETYTRDEGNKTLSGTIVRDEQGEEEDVKPKQMSCSHDDLVIVMSDDEDNGVCDAFEVRGSALDARISKLESIVSVLQANKLKSTAT